ncbi:sulfite exporter TauE/SafE family protein [Macromonas nakdongensis]|uniref:sulfite exporter TauE/SafE family protein n=1 Tax=Macromonas nakdongensis TaxID=1843082 RepID=UPI001E512DC2|nr:sulfite exporter TauE/SafE family protein [Macromonas nakdongensis]
MLAEASGLTAWGLSGGTYVAMGLMVMTGACLQGVSGLGFAMFCAPIAALLFPELVPGPLLALGCPLALMTGVREFRAIEWATAGQAIAGRLAGTGLAAWCMAWLSVQTLSLLFAGLILLGVGLSLKGWQLAHSGRNTALAGVASGLMGTITSAGAPPFAIAMQHLPAHRLRGTLGAVFFVGAAVSLVALAGVGRMGAQEFWLSLLLAPWMVAGFAGSSHLKARMHKAALRPVLLGLATFGALGVLAQTAHQAGLW